MSLHYVIDGYNLIKHQAFFFADRFKDGRLALIQFLRSEKPCGSPKNKITVVFDGYPRGLDFQDTDIEIIFLIYSIIFSLFTKKATLSFLGFSTISLPPTSAKCPFSKKAILSLMRLANSKW